MIKFCRFIPLLFLIHSSCLKEEIVYDSHPDNYYEIPSILKFNGKECFFDSERNTLKFNLDSINLSNFNPYIEFKEEASVLFEGIELDNNSSNNLGTVEYFKPYEIDIIFKNETANFKLIFINYPMLRFAVKDDLNNTTKIPGKLTVNYPELNKESEKLWTGLEYRGKSSLIYDKKSIGFRIHTSIKRNETLPHSFLGMQSSENWILDAMYIDKSRTRNKTSFELWNAMGDSESHISIQGEYVEVFINNTSYGIYSLNEDLTPEKLDANQSSLLYKGLDNSDVTYFNVVPDKLPKNIFWEDWEQVLPNPSHKIDWNDFVLLQELLVESSDGEFMEHIFEFLDKENLIDYYLFTTLCGAYDNIGKNWHFFKRHQSEKFIIVPWDMDATWGRTAFGEPFNFKSISTNGLFLRLEILDPDDYNNSIKNRWNELRAGVFTEDYLFNLFEQNFSELKNMNAFQLENEIWFTGLDPINEKAYVMNWISERLLVLDERFN